jgi:hypothetical protein
MDDPSSLPDAHVTRRDRRAHRSRRRWRRGATIVAGIALLVGFGLVVTETVRFGGGERPSLAGTVAAPGATRAPSSSTTTTIPGRKCRAPLTEADPLRLWIGGDSLAGSLGPALGTIAGGTGVVQPQFDSRVSSGLSSKGFFDWPDHAAKEMARLNPEVAVFIIGANDFNTPMNDTEGADGQPAWKTEYAALVEEMLATLDPNVRTVVWIGSPVFEDERRDAAIKQIDDLAHDVVAKHENVAYVDAYTLFTDADGEYAESLAPLDEPDAEPVPVRAGDGVHLTSQGAERLARAVYAIVDGQCRTTAQALEGVVKGTIQTEGSTLVVGGTNRGGTVQTSPPASAPQATNPPATTAPPATSPPVTTPATTAPPPTAPPTTAPPTTSTPPAT